MTDMSDEYRARIAALSQRLEAPGAVSERDAIRAELIALGKGLEQDLTELAALKEEAKGLVERWKGLQGSAAPAFSVDKPVVVDHIGASTFMEKGWSRISLGDYAGAEDSLLKALKLAPDDHSEQVFKQILGSCQSVVESLGALRNKLGDAHGGGPKKAKPAARHAELAVNLSGSMATFLVATWEARQSDEAKLKAA